MRNHWLGIILIIAFPSMAGDHAATRINNSSPHSRAALPEVQPLRLCAAIRGNGQNIFSHFAALARLSEAYGPMDAIAGGSSGSISAFFYESMMMNPAVSRCGATACTNEQKGRRVALLLKSIEEYLAVLNASPEGVAVRGLSQLATRIKTDGIETLINKGRLLDAAAALKKLLTSSEYLPLINPDIIKELEMGRVVDVYNLIKGYGDFKVTDQSLFFKPGLFDFKAFSQVLGRVADFYAGRGPADEKGMGDFLDACAIPSNTGRLWAKIKADPKSTCAYKFDRLLTAYRSLYRPDGDFPHRIQDHVGEHLPTVVSSSVLQGADLMRLRDENMSKFWASSSPQYDFHFPFSRVKFGYWGRPQDLTRIQKAFKGTTDLKSKKFLPMGPPGSQGAGWSTWEDALRSSPSEPGLANLQKYDDDRLSAGGWSDLHPTLVLKAMGCQNVVYVTRKGAESSFALDVAKQLGMTPQEENELFSLDPKQSSSFYKSLQASEGVWCSDWDKYGISNFGELIRDGYESPLVTKAPLLTRPHGVRPPKIRSATGDPGC